MVSFHKVLERATMGPIISSDDFDMKVFIPKVKEAVEKYKIRYDPETSAFPTTPLDMPRRAPPPNSTSMRRGPISSPSSPPEWA